MLAYCRNNPVNSFDPNGFCNYSVYTGGQGCYRCEKEEPFDLQGFMESTAYFVFQIANELVDNIELGVGLGAGFGGSVEATIYNIPVGAELYCKSICSLLIGDNGIDTVYITSYGAGVSVAELLGFSAESGKTHSFSDSNCSCHWDTSFYEMALCSANQQYSSTSTTLGFSIGLYFIVGGEAYISFDIKEYANKIVEVYNCAYG